MEVSILNGIANITFSEVAEQISPKAFFGLHKLIVASIVFAGHWK